MSKADTEARIGTPERDTSSEMRDFRRASVAAVGVGVALVCVGIGLSRQGAVEVGVAIAGYAAFIRAVIELAPRTHAYLAQLHPRRFFLETWREIDREAVLERASQGEKYDYRPVASLAFGAVCLTLMEYFGHSPGFHDFLDWLDPDPSSGSSISQLRTSQFLELAEFAWWSFWRVLGYLILPFLLVKVGFRDRFRDYGMETKGFLEHAWIYVLGYTVVLVCVVLVARNDAHFQTYYPFYQAADRSWLDFWSWELLYAAQFLSLEIFFRGFWLRAMKRSLGSHAIFAMVVPYCMIHFGKPFLEALAAILAGIFLGTLSMKTRSIWSGFLIHVSVAISMDVAALLATRGLPDDWLPPGW